MILFRPNSFPAATGVSALVTAPNVGCLEPPREMPVQRSAIIKVRGRGPMENPHKESNPEGDSWMESPGCLEFTVRRGINVARASLYSQGMRSDRLCCLPFLIFLLDRLLCGRSVRPPSAVALRVKRQGKRTQLPYRLADQFDPPSRLLGCEHGEGPFHRPGFLGFSRLVARVSGRCTRSHLPDLADQGLFLDRPDLSRWREGEPEALHHLGSRKRPRPSTARQLTEGAGVAPGERIASTSELLARACSRASRTRSAVDRSRPGSPKGSIQRLPARAEARRTSLLSVVKLQVVESSGLISR